MKIIPLWTLMSVVNGQQALRGQTVGTVATIPSRQLMIGSRPTPAPLATLSPTPRPRPTGSPSSNGDPTSRPSSTPASPPTTSPTPPPTCSGLNPDIGVSVCACQPAAYVFTLDFELSCCDTEISGPGTVARICVVTPVDPDSDVTDFTPTIVSEIQVLEIHEGFQVVAQSTLIGTYRDGDTFSYTSITDTDFCNLNSTSIPHAIQVSLIGNNAAEQEISNHFLIVFDEGCDLYPLVEPGAHIGWAVVTETSAPSRQICPAVSQSRRFLGE